MSKPKKSPSLLTKKDKKEKRRNRVRTAVWASVFGGAGVLHFKAEKIYSTLVPEQLPGTQKQWTYGSGIVEFLLAAAILNPGTREKAGKAAGWFLLGVLPGNIKMAWDWRNASTAMKAIAFARVPLQFPMIADVRKLR